MSTEDKARGPKGIKPELEAGTFPSPGSTWPRSAAPIPHMFPKVISAGDLRHENVFLGCLLFNCAGGWSSAQRPGPERLRTPPISLPLGCRALSAPPFLFPAGEGSVGATSAQVDAAGFGSGPSRTGMTDVGRQKREQADPSLQRGQARQEKQ